MSEKRRDNKGRILKTGESQRKDGRYAYKYIDTFGKPQFVYAWKLVSTDKTPAGKRDDVALRDKEKVIFNDLNDGIDTIGKKMTVCQLYAKQISHRTNVKRNTIAGRKHLMSILEKDKLGAKSIDSIKLSDAKEWAIRMKENGYAYKTISNYKRSLKASFYLAIQDDCIRKNPFDYALNNVLEDDTEEKVVLSRVQENDCLSFMELDKTYKQYRDEIIVLLETGLRISELCGLTIFDLDFQDRVIHVNHQLLKDSEIGYYVELPKTKKGERDIPMTEIAYLALKRILKNRGKAEPIVVDGYREFIFLNTKGFPKISASYRVMLKGLIKKYNKCHTIALPYITPHSLRHTFCTNMANKGMNPNTLQYIMGHANITMTLGYYAHGSYASAKAEMERLCA